MGSMNNSFSTVYNGLVSIEDKQMLCYMNSPIWLTDLFIVLICIQSFLLLAGSPLVFISTILFFHYDRSPVNVIVDGWTPIHDTEQRNYLNGTYGVLKREMLLVSVYVFFAFMFKWLVLVNNDNVITLMNIYQWSIEATFAPLVLVVVYIDSFFNEHEAFHQLYAPLYRTYTIILKIPLFLLMRYTETDGSFVINDFKAFVFHSICSL